MDSSLVEFDKQLFLTLNGSHHEFLDYIMLVASSLFSFAPVFLLSIYFLVKYIKKQDDYYYTFINIALLISILTIQYFLCRYFLESIFKAVCYREKPCESPDISSFVRLLNIDCFTTNHSFFSFKSCLMFCVTSFLFSTIKEGFVGFKFVLILWAILVGYSRIYVGSHYPLNVFISAITGVTVGYLISKLYFYLKNNVLVI